MLPKDTLLDILAGLRRRDLEVIELVTRALASLIASKLDLSPRRVIIMRFYEEGHVMLAGPSGEWRRLRVLELPQYLPRSVVTQITFKSTHCVTEETYQGMRELIFFTLTLRPCREYFADDIVCHFPHRFDVPRRTVLEIFTALLPCHTLIIPSDVCYRREPHAGFTSDSHNALPLHAAELPCLANCANLQIEAYHTRFFDANGALAWLLGMHATTARREKRLKCMGGFHDQFDTSTTPYSFMVELDFGTVARNAHLIGTSHVRTNTTTIEQLMVDVDKTPYGAETFYVKVNIQREPLA